MKFLLGIITSIFTGLWMVLLWSLVVFLFGGTIGLALLGVVMEIFATMENPIVFGPIDILIIYGIVYVFRSKRLNLKFRIKEFYRQIKNNL